MLKNARQSVNFARRLCRFRCSIRPLHLRNLWLQAIRSPGLPSGRFVAGTTNTPLGPLRVIGVCIPWAASHVSTGRRDRQRWEDHLRYFEALPEVLDQQRTPYILIGDFNQAVPRRTAPYEVFSSLVSNIQRRCHIVTTGEIEGCGFAIDHIAVSDELRANSVTSACRDREWPAVK